MRAKRNMSPAFRKKVIEYCGTTCKNCGSTEKVEYHHIVALSLGGKDVVSNYTALCPACHKAVTFWNPVEKYKNNGVNGGGRPRKEKEKAYRIFDMYISGEIGKKKAQELLGYSNRTTITGLVQFKEYAQEKGIKELRNNVDIVAVNSPQNLKNGREVGKIVYSDGREETIHYKDTGANDTKYKLRGKHKEEYYPEVYKIFDMYVGGEIGRKKAIQLLEPYCDTYEERKAKFSEYKNLKGIKKVRNIVDMVGTLNPEELLGGRYVGDVVYKDGRTDAIEYKDTGMNDVEYKPPKKPKNAKPADVCNNAATVQVESGTEKQNNTDGQEETNASKEAQPEDCTATKSEVLEILGISASQLCYLRSMGIIPGKKIGPREYTYSQRDVERVIKSGTLKNIKNIRGEEPK